MHRVTRWQTRTFVYQFYKILLIRTLLLMNISFLIFIVLELFLATFTSIRKVRVHFSWPHRNLWAPLFEAIDCNLCFIPIPTLFLLILRSKRQVSIKEMFVVGVYIGSSRRKFSIELIPSELSLAITEVLDSPTIFEHKTYAHALR